MISNMRNVDEIYNALSKSKFRSGFKLGPKELQYFDEKGTDVIAENARDFIIQRLAPANPENDGKQTPFKGHPVFMAQHATATCCRSCLAKWHRIPKGKPLSDEQIRYIVLVIKLWLENQMLGTR